MTDANYDHTRSVTAFFDTRAAADKALADVVAAGVPSHEVSIVAGNERSGTGTTATTTTGSQDPGFWGSVKNLFAPEEDKHVYAEGLHRGGFLLTAQTSEAHYEQVLDILDREGAVDMDERESQWKSEGWSGYHGATTAVGTSAAASYGTNAPGAGHATSTAATGTPVGLAGTSAAESRTATGDGAPVAERGLGALGEETIQLAEESLRVGKRDVNHGRVRLRSYVVEKPVHESVNLRSEQVDIARKPVDRALGVDEALFQDRTISVEEHSEEAVVSKEARVYEEVTLGKRVQDRTQEINETVRKTEVEVDDGRTGGVGRAGAGVGERTPAAGALRADIAEHMPVIASDGSHVGTVDHHDGERIKLTKNDSPDGQHHFIPTSWIDHVDTHVHLNKTPADVRSGWTV